MLFPYLKEGETKIITIIDQITNFLSKPMEKIVHPRLYSFLEKNSLFFEQQYGFQKNLSTNHALIDITSKIHTACDKRNLCLC